MQNDESGEQAESNSIKSGFKGRDYKKDVKRRNENDISRLELEVIKSFQSERRIIKASSEVIRKCNKLYSSYNIFNLDL